MRGPAGRPTDRQRGDREEVSRATRGDQWLLPPRQLPFRWKCDGCPLFCMIKYRRKNRLGKADQPLVSRGRSRSRKESEDLSKNPCTLHRESERALLAYLSRRHCDARKRETRANLFPRISQNTAAASRHEREMSRRNELMALSFASPMKSPRSRNFPRQMSHFHRLHGCVIPRRAG